MYQSDYRPRLEKAIELYRFYTTPLGRAMGHKPRKIKTVKDLIDAIEKRATTEKQLRDLFGSIMSLLEPPSCSKSHCEFYGGSFAWCSCRKGLVPGTCRENRAYLKRRREREEKSKSAAAGVTDTVVKPEENGRGYQGGE